MVQLVDDDIRTSRGARLEGRARPALHGLIVLTEAWIFLNLKGINWESHLVDLFANENFQPWFLGINPAGWCRCWCTTVPCTSKATTLSSTSNRNFQPHHSFQPAANELAALLKHEDDLHLDLRN